MDKFQIRIDTDEFRFRYAKGVIEETGKEFHPHHEIFFLFDGEVELFSEIGKIKLFPGTLIIVPKEHLHQFINTGNETDYLRCTFAFENIEEYSDLINCKLKRLTVFQINSASELSSLFEKAKSLVFSDRTITEQKILLKAYLAEILVHLDSESQAAPNEFFILSPLVKQAIAYINRNIATDLSLNVLAKQLHVSASHLSHIFKSEIRMPIRKYIIQKRLLLANEKIMHSIPASTAAAECGFHDYSNFYQQYKKYWGVAPSQSPSQNTLLH